MHSKLFTTFILGALSALGTSAAPLDKTVELVSRDAASDAFLGAHNSARAKYGANPLTWSTAILPGVQQWASACKFQHSQPGGKYGENLYASTGTSNFTAAVTAWMSEAPKYNYSQPVFSAATGHFTQVVWKSTTQVACVRAACPAGTIFASAASQYTVCRYTPPGNYQGQFAQNVGRPVA